MNKTFHFEHYRGNEEFVKRVYDLIDQCIRRQRIIITPFFSPEQMALVETLCGHQVAYAAYGGYEGAQRNRIAFLPFPCIPDYGIVSLKGSYSLKTGSLSHRDVLGAAMHLGLKRETLGDIIVKKDDIYIFVDANVANYVCSNLIRIGRVNICFSPCEETVTYDVTIHYSHHIVSSLRLDALVASLAKVSRSRAQSMIMAGQVKVNHVPLEQTSYLCNNNSAISIRGYGRFHFKEVIKETKKKHFVIDVGVYE